VLTCPADLVRPLCDTAVACTPMEGMFFMARIRHSAEQITGKLRDELLNSEIYDTLREAKILIECWRRHHNKERPHSSLGYQPPAPETRSPGPHSAPRGSGTGGGPHIDSGMNQGGGSRSVRAVGPRHDAAPVV